MVEQNFLLLSEFTRFSFFNQTFSMQFHIWIGMGTIWLPNWLIFHSIICNRKSFQNFVNIWNNIYFCSWLLTNDWFPFNDCGQKSESTGNLCFWFCSTPTRLGSSGQDSVRSGIFCGFLNVSLRGGSQMTFMTHLEKVIIFRYRHFFVTNGGFQVTFMTQPEKVIIFRYRHFSSPTGGSNWPFK